MKLKDIKEIETTGLNDQFGDLRGGKKRGRITPRCLAWESGYL